MQQSLAQLDGLLDAAQPTLWWVHYPLVEVLAADAHHHVDEVFEVLDQEVGELAKLAG